MKKQLSFAIALAVGITPHVQAAGILYGATTYNVFVFQTFKDSDSSVQGGLAVGGSATISSLTVGNSISSVAPFASFGGYTLIGSTNLTASNGDLGAGNGYDGSAGGVSGSFVFQSGSLTSGGTQPVDFSSDASGIKSYSSSTLANSGQTNGTAGDSCTLSGSVLTCAATANGLNTIYVSGSTFAAATGGYTITSSKAGATVLLDITGTSDSILSTGWTLTGIAATNIMLNFYQATGLDFEGLVPVSVLAPYAAVNGISGTLTGNLIATSFTSSNGYGFNSANFAGSLPGSTPESPSLLLAGCGLIGASMVGRKRLRARGR